MNYPRIPRWAWIVTLTTTFAAVTIGARTVLPRTPAEHSVAVLAFSNLDDDPSRELISDGLAADLATALTEVQGLHVVPRTSAFAFKGRLVDAREIGNQLGASEVLEGGIRRSGNGFHVTANLVRTRDGATLWSKSFDRPDGDLLAVRDDISRAIARTLRIKWTPESAGSRHVPPIEAHEAYLRGLASLDRRSEQALRRAIGFFQQAIALDSGHAPAYAGLAAASTYLADAFVPPDSAYPRAIAAANTAIALDSTLADARATLGYAVLSYQADPDAARAILERAIRENPNSACAYEYLSFVEISRRRPRHAIAAARRALELDPLSPVASGLVEWWFLLSGQPDSALAQHAVTARLAPGVYTHHDSFLGDALRQKGIHMEALAEYAEASRMLGHATAGYAITLHLLGRTPEARSVLAEMEAHWPKTYIAPELIAGVHARLGDFNRAVAWLEKGVTMKSGLSPLVGMLPDLEPLRDDPRYQAILRRRNIPEQIGDE